MKILKWFSITILLSSLLLTVISTGIAIPPLPSSFYGSVKTNGVNIPEGAILKAVIEGESFALAIIEIFEGASVYSLDIPGDDLNTINLIEGGKPGDTIHFMMGENLANETGIWGSGSNEELNLAFDELTSPAISASFYGSVKINGKNPPSGTIIEAVINGVTYVTCPISLYNGKTVYALSIPGDEPSTSGIIEGGVNGDVVEFLIDKTPADQTGIWLSGNNTEINLTAYAGDDPNWYYFPLINK